MKFLPSSSHLRVLLGAACLLAVVLAATSTPAQDATITLKTLHTFHGTGDGAYPYGGLLLGQDGNFYGTTYGGGLNGLTGGTLFRLEPDGTFATLVSYEIAQPFSTLLPAIDGDFYGTTSLGGRYGAGFIFRLSPSGTGSGIVSAFNSAATGGGPHAGLTLGANGLFYGVTVAGGATGGGAVFRATRTGDLTLLHSFDAAQGEGTHPYGELVLGRDGNFYGTAAADGSRQFGTVFRVSPFGVVSTVHAFTGGADGSNPRAALLLGGDGNFYGTATSGGAAAAGSVFQLTPQGTLTVLHTFTGGAADGANPQAALVDGGDGKFYGTTTGGGPAGAGTIFSVSPTGDYALVYSFNGTTEGAQPVTPLTRAGSGLFYGTTGAGGDGKGKGTLYRLNLNTLPQVPGTLSFTVATTSVNENAGTVTLTVDRVGGTTGGVTVQYATVDGTAKAGRDYLAVTGALVWRDGDATPRSFTVPISDLGLSDGSTRGFTVRLAAPTGGATLGTVATATVGILENDPPAPPVLETVSLTVLGDGTATVGGANGKIVFTRDGDTELALTVNYRVQGKPRNGSDYELLSGTLVIPAGQTSAKLKIKPRRTAAFKGTAKLKIIPIPPQDGSFQYSPAKAKIVFVNNG